MIKTGDNCEDNNILFKGWDLERLASAMFALSIGSIALSIALNGLRDIMKKSTICKECFKKAHIATADFGGKFRCKICNSLVTMVPSLGHGVACNKCQENGYCQYCGKRILEII